MTRALRILAVASAVSFLFAASSMAGEVRQEKCPIMGYKPSDKLFVDYQGKRIYFCCASCPETFMKDPDTYMKKLQAEGITLEDSPDTPSGAEASEGSQGTSTGGR
ncbi:MAG: hypothetical protein R6X27_13775 [Candidatus Desulfacyla sp.]